MSAAISEHATARNICPSSRTFISSGKQSQGAHEAIRPTAVERDPESIARYLDKDVLALYTLIYNRFVSSQMKQAVYDRTTVDIEVSRRDFPRHRPGDEVRRLHARLYRRPGRASTMKTCTLPRSTKARILTLLGLPAGAAFHAASAALSRKPR